MTPQLESSDSDSLAASNGSQPECLRHRPERLLRLPEVIKRVGLKRSAIYARMREGRFPKCRTLGTRCAVWIESEVDAWIADISKQEAGISYRDLERRKREPH